MFDPAFYRKLCDFMLQAPCSLESGFRTAEHNRSVGGAARSAHLTGHAADLILDTHVNIVSVLHIASDMGFLGLEYNTIDKHLHLDWHPNGRLWRVVIQDGQPNLPLSDFFAHNPII